MKRYLRHWIKNIPQNYDPNYQGLLSNDSPHNEQFHRLLDQIRDEVDSLKNQVKSLKKENSQLKDQIKEIQDGQTDIYSAISETERMALRHQVLGLISKIDEHLEDGQ